MAAISFLNRTKLCENNNNFIPFRTWFEVKMLQRFFVIALSLTCYYLRSILRYIHFIIENGAKSIKLTVSTLKRVQGKSQKHHRQKGKEGATQDPRRQAPWGIPPSLLATVSSTYIYSWNIENQWTNAKGTGNPLVPYEKYEKTGRLLEVWSAGMGA